MTILTDAYITAQLGGTVAGAAQYDALAPDASAKAAHIASADAVVVGAARKGGYSSVSSTGPVPASGEALAILQEMAFTVWWARVNLLVRGIQAPTVGLDPSALYAAVDEGRVDLPGLARDALGGPAGADLVSGTSITTSSAYLGPILTREALEGGGFG